MNFKACCRKTQRKTALTMQQYRNCDFSFSGLQSLVNKAILQKEKEEGTFKVRYKPRTP